VRVLDDGPDPTRRRRIEQALAGKPVRLARIHMEAPPASEATAPSDAPATAFDDLGSLDPEQIMIAAHRERYATEPDAALLAALREVLAAEPHASPAAP
jgi:exonuclease SbcD